MTHSSHYMMKIFFRTLEMPCMFCFIIFAIHITNINTDIRTVARVTATASANYCGPNSSTIILKRKLIRRITIYVKFYTIYLEATRWWVCKAPNCVVFKANTLPSSWVVYYSTLYVLFSALM